MAKEWISGSGNIAITSMTDEHLMNTVALIVKRLREYEEIRDISNDYGYLIPSYRVQGKPAMYWIKAMIKELSVRNKRKIKEAKEFLNQEG